MCLDRGLSENEVFILSLVYQDLWGRMLGVSILVRAHEDAPWLIAALNSIASQDYTGKTQILVSLDRPTDNLLNRINDWPLFDKLDLFRMDYCGLSAPLNAMIEKVKTEYICILDSDDLMLPGRISAQVEYLEKNKNIAVVGSGIKYIDAHDNSVGFKRYPDSARHIQKHRLKRLPVAHPAVMMRTKVVQEVGGYRTFYDYAEDFDLWVRILEKYEMSNLNEVLTCYRLHELQSTKLYNHKNVLAAISVIDAANARKVGRLEPHSRYSNIEEFASKFSVRCKVMRKRVIFELNTRIKVGYTKRYFHVVLIFGILLFLLRPFFISKKIALHFRAILDR